MSLGIIAALNEEGRTLAGRPAPCGELVRFPEGGILLIAGIGPDRAALASRILIENGARALMSWGFACGLQPGIKPGEIIIPRLVIAADGAVLPTDPAWRERLYSRLSASFSITEGGLAESRGLLPDSPSKELLGRTTGAVAADMESASICTAARNAGVPFLAVRAVTDTLGMRVPGCAAGCIDRQGSIRVLRLLAGLLQRPADLPDLIRLARSFRTARRSLQSAAAHRAYLFFFEENRACNSSQCYAHITL